MFFQEIQQVEPAGLEALQEVLNTPPVVLRRGVIAPIPVPVTLGFGIISNRAIRLRLAGPHHINISQDSYYQKHGMSTGTVTICGRVGDVNPTTDIEVLNDGEGNEYPDAYERKKFVRRLGRGAFMRVQFDVTQDGILLPPVAMLAVLQPGDANQQRLRYSSGRQIFEAYDETQLLYAEQIT